MATLATSSLWSFFALRPVSLNLAELSQTLHKSECEELKTADTNGLSKTGHYAGGSKQPFCVGKVRETSMSSMRQNADVPLLVVLPFPRTCLFGSRAAAESYFLTTKLRH